MAGAAALPARGGRYSVSVMPSPYAAPSRPFGQVLTAMVTPFHPDGALDVEGAAELATWLVDEGGNDGLVVSGTTGESPTTTDAEKEQLLRAVVEAVGDRASIVAGAATNDTAHSVHLARTAERAGAHGLLVVSPYYSKPPQAGLVQHCRTVADSTGLPVMLYDIPGRTATAFAVDTLVVLAEHPLIVAVKDAKGDIAAASWAMARSDLAFYSGDDIANLSMLALGGVGFVSVIGHLVGQRLRLMLTEFARGDTAAARDTHLSLLPVVTGVMTRMQGCVAVKAALSALGRPAGPVRLPLVAADAEQLARLRAELTDGGVSLPHAGPIRTTA